MSAPTLLKIQGLFYGLPTPHYFTLFSAFIILAILTIIIFISFKTKENTQIKRVLNIAIILTITIFINNLSHYLIGTKFLIHRTALIYYPIFCVFIIEFIFYLSNFRSIKFYLNVGLVLITAFLGVLFSLTYSGESYLAWKFNSDSKQISTQINQLGKLKNTSIQIGCDMKRQPPYNYYREILKLNFLNTTPKNRIPSDVNVLILDTNNTYEKIDQFEIIEQHKNSGTNIYVAKYLLKKSFNNENEF